MLNQHNRLAQLIQSTREAGVELFHFALFPEGEAMQRFNRTNPDACVTSLTSTGAWATGSSLVILQDFAQQVHPEDASELGLYIQQHLDKAAELQPGELQQFTSSRFRVVRPDGTSIWYEIRSRLFFHETGVVVAEGLFTQVTDLMNLLLHDPLTGLNNRLAAEQKLQKLLEQRRDTPLAVINLDLDHFRTLNTCLGQERGDQLIRDTAAILRALVQPDHWLARIGADEFLILVEGPDAPGADQDVTPFFNVVQALGRELQRELPQRLALCGWVASRFTACCGIAVRQHGDRDGRPLLIQASSALSQAKQQGPGSLCLFSKDLEDGLQRRLRLEQGLNQALRQNRLSLRYQPKVDRQGRWIGAEVLVRLPMVDGRMIGPEVFIPVAEQTGQIHELGLWVLEEACIQLGRWHRQGLQPCPLAINLSSIQLEHTPQGQQPLLATVRRLCAEHGIPCELLSFELTETALLHDWQQALAQLQPLADAGIELAIDDFGTGYSSLKLLQTLPVTLIKLDKGFVQNLPDSSSDCRLVTGSLEIARNLGLGTLAEGVETEAQWQCLQDLGCDSYQGYLFSPPLSAEAFEAELRRQSNPSLVA